MRERAHLLVCAGAGCVSSGCHAVRERLEQELARHHLGEEIRIVQTGCIGPCDLGPIIILYPDRVFYARVKPKDVTRIVESHLLKGRVVSDLLMRSPQTNAVVESMAEFVFFSRQQKIVLANCGLIDAESIDEYIARDGYLALGRALTEMTRQEVIGEVKASGLRGRGGAGFPTGRKWELVSGSPAGKKYVVCNADEGDPGAFMDRSVLEGDPHRIIEAMAIAAYAVGADEGFIYVRAEYPLAIRRLEIALRQARAYGLLGASILETGFRFDLSIRVGAGAFVCGEETALLASIAGRRGQPVPRPPFPAVSGLFGQPTLINNVETYANIPPILLRGSGWFAGIGTQRSKGTKVFALAGRVRNTGLVEVPMGTSLREIVFDIGGGVPDGKAFKAAQTGGPSGGCIPAEHLDISMDYDSLAEIGSMIGSGGLIIMDEDSCMVDVAHYFLDFCVDESCGKCPPCRVGTVQMRRILERITRGEAQMSDLDRLEELCAAVRGASLCGLGQTAPNPILSTLHHFRREYEAHIRDRACPARVCRALIRFDIDLDACVGCGVCFRNCPVKTIFKVEGEKKYFIEQPACIQCGACLDVCKFDAVQKTTRSPAVAAEPALEGGRR